MAGAVAAAGAAQAAPGVQEPTARDIGAMLMAGFSGDRPSSPGARALARMLADGRVGAVVFERQNVGSRENVAGLVALFKDAAPLASLAIDHEGGAVQRLGPSQGCRALPTAREVAARMSVQEARALYAQAGADLAALGFSINLGPVVDRHDPANVDIGARGRAFDGDPQRVVAYASAFVDGFASAGIGCALKHFPGVGGARQDAHVASPDMTGAWSRLDLEPFHRLIASGRAGLVMTGHAQVSTLGAAPASLSKAIVSDLLRGELGFSGVAMTDDLDMAAVATRLHRKEALLRALAAGNDLVMIRNEEPFDPDLPEKIVEWVRAGVASGQLDAAAIARSAERVRGLGRRA